MISASQWLASKNTYFCRGFYGPTGDTGNQGDPGLNGIEGNTGNNGNSGGTGSQGQGGLFGNTGNSGNSGIAGGEGLSGISGLTRIGSGGDLGIGGMSGLLGDGTTGDKGLSGNIGITGSVGLRGSRGLTGEQGNQSVDLPYIINGYLNTDNAIDNYVYTFRNFSENNNAYKGQYKFIAYINKTNSSTLYENITSTYVIFDFIIFPTFGGTSKVLPITYKLFGSTTTTYGIPLLSFFENTLYLGFTSREQAFDPKYYYWELYKLNVGF